NIGDELTLQETTELPPFAQVLEQRLAAELCEYINRIDSRIHKIAENEINDPVLPPKGNGWLGAFSRKRVEPGAFSSRQHDSQDSAAKSGSCGGLPLIILRHAALQSFPQDGIKRGQLPPGDLGRGRFCHRLKRKSNAYSKISTLHAGYDWDGVCAVRACGGRNRPARAP